MYISESELFTHCLQEINAVNFLDQCSQFSVEFDLERSEVVAFKQCQRVYI
jgi:hypothetical protein